MTDTSTSTRRPGASATPSDLERDAAIAAMLTADAPPPASRRAVLTTAAALTGTIVGWPLYKGTGRDLSFVAECWLRDAYDVGMLVIKQPDGEIWRSEPIGDAPERKVAREQLRIRLENRPRLRRAVIAAVERGFQPWAEV